RRSSASVVARSRTWRIDDRHIATSIERSASGSASPTARTTPRRAKSRLGSLPATGSAGDPPAATRADRAGPPPPPARPRRPARTGELGQAVEQAIVEVAEGRSGPLRVAPRASSFERATIEELVEEAQVHAGG